LFNWFVGAGSWWKTEGGTKHSVEVQYDAADKKPGLMGQPLFLRYGMKSKIGTCDYNMQALLGQTLSIRDKADFKVNDKLKLGFTANYDLQELVTKGESSNINMGISAELKI